MKNSVKKSLFPVLCTLSLLGTTTQINCMWKKVVAGTVGAGLSIAQTLYSANMTKKRRKVKKRYEPYLAPKHVQEKARELYDTVCTNERKWWNIPGKIRDWKVRKFNHLDIYQGVNDIYFKKNNWCAYTNSTGIYFPSESFTSITPLNDEQRGTLLHEVIHKYRGDIPQGIFKSLINIRRLKRYIRRLKRYEFETEKLTTISLAKMEDWDALSKACISSLNAFDFTLNENPQYQLGTLAGLATIVRTIPGAENHLIKGENPWQSHPVFKVAKTTKPMGFFRSMRWYKKLRKEVLERVSTDINKK